MSGRELIDYHAAYGAIILGHAYQPVTAAVAASLDIGVLFGLGTTTREVALARRIVELVPSVETVLLGSTGSEATLNAIRVARAYTGRQLVVKFQGAYHGSHDYMLRNTISPPELVGKRDPGSAGMLDAAVDSTIVCRFNDLEDVREVFDTQGEQIAALVIEPIMHNAPTIIPRPGFLEGLRTICDTWGALLVFDEVITGFRHHIGGYQAIAQITPDLTTMGKALGNGFTVSALGGRRDIMARFSTADDGDVFYGGTFHGSQVGATAALATLEEMTTRDVFAHIFDLGDRMRAGLRDIAHELAAPVVVTGYGSLYNLTFIEGSGKAFSSYDDVAAHDRERPIRYRRALIRRGVFEMPDHIGRGHISFSHTSTDIDRTLEIAREALREALQEG